MDRTEIGLIVFQELEDASGVPAKEIVDATLLKDTLGFDSLMLLQLTLDLENEFSITIPWEDVQDFKTAGQIIEYIKGKIN